MKLKLQKTIYMMSRYFLFGFAIQMLVFNFVLAVDVNGQYKSIDEVQVKIDKGYMTLSQFFNEIERQTPFQFSYDNKAINKKARIVLEKNEGTVMDFLVEVSQQASLSFRQVNNNIDTKKKADKEPISQETEVEITVSGKVIDDKGEPLPGALITVAGTTTGTVADFDGNYTLTVSDGATLIFSFIGFEAMRVPVDNRSRIDVSLKPDISSLEEVVVIGYGTVKKSDMTGSVAQVKSKEVNAFPTTNVLQALAGRAAGVQIIQNNGAPGAGISVRIRGTNSIQGGNEPLYVIDGFPFSGNPTNLNNADIESIEVLKDASATAIYGSRGANGVVLITTKRGTAGQSKVEFETSYSQQTLRKKLNLMNGSEYALLQNIQAENDKLTPYFTEAEINGFGEGFDWQDLVFRAAPIKSTSLNVSGGSKQTQYGIAGSVFDQEGIIRGSDYNRYSIRTNIKHALSDKFSVSMSNTLSQLTTDRRDSGGGSRGNSMIGAAISAAPISQPYNEDGSYTVLGNAYPFIAPDVINPLNFINEQTNSIKANVTLLNAALVYNPIPELTIRISGGIENRDDRNDQYTTLNFFNSDGRASVSSSQFVSRLNENTINYTKTFNGKHQISALLGFTYQDFETKFIAGSGVGFLSDAFETYSLQSSGTPGIPSSGYSKGVLLSYLGRLNYNLSEKYLFTFNFRTDGSSRYSEGNKWGYFPSGAVAWRVSEESFMHDQDVVSEMKLRGSWGVTGSQAISPYATLNQLFPGNTVFGNALYTTFAPSTTLPGDLKWETTEQFNVGLDLGLLNNRLFITADYYVKNTRDLLNTVRLPSSLGFNTTIQNIGEVQNKGIELGLDYKVLTGAFRWDVSGNISFNRNKVVSLYNGADILGNFINVLVVGDNFSILREGRPIGQFWGYVEDGYNEQGRIRFKDLNEDGQINQNDKTYIGDPNPDFIYGLNSNMAFKNFELNIFVQGSQGNDIFNVSSIVSTMDFGQGMNMPKEVLYNRWTPQNPNAKYPLISRNTSARVSDRFVEDGSYMRLKNILLAYNLPIQSFGINWIKSAQVYVSGQNLLTLTKYSWWDPEVSSRGAGTQMGIDHFSYPVPKVFTVGLRAGF
jgi:TonB-dependent starch-binding outer membrane protein SusC